MQWWLTIQAWTEFAYADLLLVRGFERVHQKVRRTPVRRPGVEATGVAAVVAAVQTAQVLYVKPARCLQRSVVLTRLLRRRGVPADLVIGCHLPPLTAHAWVEVAGRPIDENHPGLQFFRILDRW